ncbi:MAG: pullulanase, partial [Sediminicola sp.]
MVDSLSIVLICTVFVSCAENKKTFTNYNDYPTPILADLWLDYSKKATEFKIWSPTAEKVQVHLYNEGDGGEPVATYLMNKYPDGIWKKLLSDNLHGSYYTYQVQVNGRWLDETPGIYAQSVGVNGERAMVLDLETTNPKNWRLDQGPEINYTNEAIIYELHIRDVTIHPESGSSMPGKYLGLVEEGTTGPSGIATGMDHIKEMGVTHVHLLPAFDNYSINETKLDSAQFNWGYDPNNYNVPEGSFSSNPYRAEVRIKE